MQAVGKVLHVWQRILVRGCHQIETAVIATRPPRSVFFGTMCKVEAHGDFERKIMPADSNLFELRFGNLQFFRIEAAGFCKNRGMAASVDVMLNPMGWCWFPSPVRKI